MKFKDYFSLDKTPSLSKIDNAIKNKRSCAVFYAVENCRYHITSCIESFFLYVTPDRLSARRAQKLLSAYTGSDIPIIFERENALINSYNVNVLSLGERLKALWDIIEGKIKGAVISAEGLQQYYPQKQNFLDAVKVYETGGKAEPEEAAAALVQAGYKRVERVEDRGEFSLKGDILNVYAYDNEQPCRLEFFDGAIEAIRRYDLESFKVTEKLDKLTVIPASDILINPEHIKKILANIERARKNAGIRLSETLGNTAQRFKNNPNDPSLVWLIPFMSENFESIFDYLPPSSVIVFDDLRSVDDKLKLMQNAHGIRVKNFIESGEASSRHYDAIISVKEIYEKIKSFTKLGFSAITSANPVFEPQEIFTIRSQSVPKYFNNFNQLIDDIKSYAANGAKIFIYTKKYNHEAFIKNLQHNYIGAKKFNYGDKEGEVNVLAGDIPSGFVYNADKLVVIGNEDIERKREASRSVKRSDFVLPQKGDYVVHEKHGIGISEGMQRVKTTEGYKDFYVVLYKDADRLYLPAGQLDTLEKYSGADKPVLHRLGGAEFAKVKKKAKESIKKMTIDLIKLYERRHKQKGHKYAPDTVWQKELEDSFEFEETEDQLKAISEIKQDMEQGKIMDRLICGDVGYGKTEVAIRAIFKTVIEGKQAAVLAPTTILAQQHFNTISARLNPFKLKIAHMSRFVPPAQIKQNLEKIKSGEINIIVGTHRLLSKDVIFADLGLLVLDEEQRFGVEHKEKIKTLRSNVNVLSLTATPIPRTLHMSLSGIRDISVLETPPANRLPIETYVTEYSDSLLTDAVRRELARNGQVFILYNKVSTIEAFYKHVVNLLGNEAEIIYAHGQMKSAELEDRIRLFYERKASVMVSTSIIENGIDLPFANTLIVIDADNFGLSQLYQLRGRVGRSDVPAYAYFTVREGKALTENAAKRLEALMEYTDLGSGFKVALRDLDIRGAGNVLGREQSGHMEKVGYDMYCRMIKEAIEEAQGKTITEKKEIELNIEGDHTLPEEYISSPQERLKFYKKVSALSSMSQAKEFIAELKRDYKEPPQSVYNIIATGIIKNLAQSLQIRKVTVGKKGGALYFYDDSCLQNRELFDALSSMKDRVALLPLSPPQIIFRNKDLDQTARLKMTLEFLLKASKAEKANICQRFLPF